MNNIIINKKEKQGLKDLYLHDAEVKKIYCNYAEHIVNIPIVVHSPQKKGIVANLSFSDVKQLNVNIDEPWGAGFYINEFIAGPIKHVDSHLRFTMLLNSGDEISIIAREMLYNEIYP